MRASRMSCPMRPLKSSVMWSRYLICEITLHPSCRDGGSADDAGHDVTRRRPVIAAVVVDIGSVLEVIDDAVFPAPFEQRAAAAAGGGRGRLGLRRGPRPGGADRGRGPGPLADPARTERRPGRRADGRLLALVRRHARPHARRLVRRGPGEGAQGRDPLQLRPRSPGGGAALGLRGDDRRHRLLPRGRAGQARPCRLRADRRPARGRARTRSSSWTTWRSTSTRPARPAGTPSTTWTPRARSPSWSG